MQKYLMVIMGLTLTVGSMAHADAPPRINSQTASHPKTPALYAAAPASLPPQVLGQIDGIWSFCTKIDSRDGDKFEKLHRLMNAGSQNSEVMAKNADYRASFELIRGILGSVSADDALRLCKDAVK